MAAPAIAAVAGEIAAILPQLTQAANAIGAVAGVAQTASSLIPDHRQANHESQFAGTMTGRLSGMIGRLAGSNGFGGPAGSMLAREITGTPMALASDAVNRSMMFARTGDEARVGSQMASAASGLVGQVTNTMMNPVDPRNWMELGSTIVNLIPMIESWGDALAQSADRLKQFDANMATGAAISERGDVTRAVDTARATGESTLQVIEELELLKNDLQPIRNFLTNTLNMAVVQAIRLGRAGVDAAETTVEILFAIAEALAVISASIPALIGFKGIYAVLKSIRDKMDKTEPSSAAMSQNVIDIARQRREQYFGRSTYRRGD